MDKKEITKVVAFFTMSDGSLVKRVGVNTHAYFSLNMCEKNIDILDYLKPYITAIDVGYSQGTYELKGKRYFTFRTKTHPFFTIMYERIYIDRRKQPSPHDFKLLDWEAIAILYMCDGNIQKAGKKWYPMLNLCRWNYAELSWVQHQFKDTLALDTSIYKCGKYFRLGVPARHTEYFFENIKPFITPSFSYKLPYGKPQVILGDDIVRPVGKPTDTDGNTLYL
jgi:hypothetical protein